MLIQTWSQHLRSRGKAVTDEQIQNKLCGQPTVPSIFHNPKAIVCKDTIHFKFTKNGGGILAGDLLQYASFTNDKSWHLSSRVPGKDFPAELFMCRQTDVPVRTAKHRLQFREAVLKAMLASERIRLNQVLFKCNTCKNRFPTFHPDHRPSSCKACAIATQT